MAALARSTACLLALLGIAGCLSACGGGGETAGSSSQSPAPTASDEREAQQGASQGSSPAQAKPPRPVKTEAQERAEYEKARYGSPSGRSAPFRKYSGKGQTPLHLAEFGVEADAEARAGAQATITAYLASAEAGEWEAACIHLTREVKEQLQATAGPDGPQGCPAQLRKTIASAEETGQSSLVSAPRGIVSLRVQQEAGFALFHGSDGSDRWMAMRVEDGEWKVLSATPQSFG